MMMMMMILYVLTEVCDGQNGNLLHVGGSEAPLQNGAPCSRPLNIFLEPLGSM